MSEKESRSPIPHSDLLKASSLSAAAHAGFAMLLLLFLWLEIPTYEAAFEDLAVVAPRPTLFVLTAADSIRSSPWTLVLLVASTLVLDGVVHYALHRWAPRAWSRLWGWALAVLLIGCIALVYLAVHVPFAQVVQNASVYRSR